MKLITTLAALALSATAAQANTPDFSDSNSGLTKGVMCTNVPARSGSVTGFYVENIGYFVMNGMADYATVDAIELPAGVHPKDAADVTGYLASVGLTNFELVIRRDTDTRTVTETETVVAERGVATGDVPSGDNLTSMGFAASDGAAILRVRSTTAQDVSIRKAGGDTFTVSVGAGDTLVPVSGGGTYIATFQGTHVTKTKATGPQTFNDLSEVEIETIVRMTSNPDWCK